MLYSISSTLSDADKWEPYDIRLRKHVAGQTSWNTFKTHSNTHGSLECIDARCASKLNKHIFKKYETQSPATVRVSCSQTFLTCAWILWYACSKHVPECAKACKSVSRWFHRQVCFHVSRATQDLKGEPAEAVSTSKSQSNEIDWSEKEPCGTLVCKQMPWMASAEMQQIQHWHHSLLQLWRATFSQLSLRIRCIRNSLQNRVLGSTWFNWEEPCTSETATAIFRGILRTSHRPDTNMHQLHTNLWPSKALPSACIELLEFGHWQARVDSSKWCKTYWKHWLCVHLAADSAKSYAGICIEPIIQ